MGSSTAGSRTSAETKTRGFQASVRSFLGFISGTRKSTNTLSSYRSDLESFRRFLETGLGQKTANLRSLTRGDLIQFDEFLKAQGHKTNSRRRRMMTIRKFFGYLHRRKYTELDVGKRLPTPHKVERLQGVADWEDLRRRVAALPEDNPLLLRNKVLLWTILETGAQVSEVATVEFRDLDRPMDFVGVRLTLRCARNAEETREIELSSELSEAYERLEALSGGRSHCFQGFNRHGPLPGAVSPRGVELICEAYRGRLGVLDLTPRALRVARVAFWLRTGESEKQVQQWLGLKSDYAFRVYRVKVDQI